MAMGSSGWKLPCFKDIPMIYRARYFYTCCGEPSVFTIASCFAAQVVTGTSPPHLSSGCCHLQQNVMGPCLLGRERAGQTGAGLAGQKRVGDPGLHCAGVHLGCDTSLRFWWRHLCASLRQQSRVATRCLSLLWPWSWKHRKKWMIYCWFCYTFWLGKKKPCRLVPIAGPGSALSSSLLLPVSPPVMFSHSFVLPPLYFSNTVSSSVLTRTAQIHSSFYTCLWLGKCHDGSF